VNWLKCIDISALLIQLIAAIIMFLNSPNNTETNAAFFDDYDEVRPIENKRNKRLKSGFLLLLIGITISLLSTLIK
jgi:hypothetical protein